MEFLGNANKDITTDPRHIRVNYKGVFIGRGTIQSLSIAEGDYIEFVKDRHGYLWLRKSNANYGYRLKKVNQHLYVNNVSLARDIAKVAYGSYQKEFEPFILLTTDLSTDTDGNECVEVFTSRIFRTRMYYDKKEKI